MSRRVNVTLNDDTAAIVEAVPAAERDQFIDAAIRQRGKPWPRADLRQQLQEGAIARAQRDRDLAEEWVSLEEEVCPTPEA